MAWKVEGGAEPTRGLCSGPGLLAPAQSRCRFWLGWSPPLSADPRGVVLAGCPGQVLVLPLGSPGDLLPPGPDWPVPPVPPTCLATSSTRGLADAGRAPVPYGLCFFPGTVRLRPRSGRHLETLLTCRENQASGAGAGWEGQ